MPKKKKAAGKSKEDKKMDAEMMARAQAIAKENDAKAKAAAEEKAAADAAESAELMAKYAELGLQESDIMEYREMFNLVDADGGGSIGREEVLDLMGMVGYQCTEEEVDDMISEIDTDGNMEIDFDEFVTMMSRKPDALRHPEEILAAFKLFEKSIDDSPGYVRHSALVHGLTNLADEKLSLSEATELLSQLPEPDERGFVNYADYISMMAQ